jgi:hypothetical protein
MTDEFPSSPEPLSDEALAPIRDALRGLRFGNVNVIVQDGVIVQIDRTEKRRLTDSERKPHVIGN